MEEYVALSTTVKDGPMSLLVRNLAFPSASAVSQSASKVGSSVASSDVRRGNRTDSIHPISIEIVRIEWKAK